jgi:hypothetical protein
MNRKHQPARILWIFHWVVPSLVLRIVGIMRRVHRVFEAFADLDRDLAWFVELSIFPMCDQFLVPWSRGIEPWLIWPDIQRSWSTWVAWVPRFSGYSAFSQIMHMLSALWSRDSWSDYSCSCEILRFWTLIKICVPPSLLLTKCSDYKMVQSSSSTM